MTDFLSGHRLIGAAKMRQVRIKSNACSVPSQLGNTIDACYGTELTKVEEKTPFGPNDTYVWSANSGGEEISGIVRKG